MYPCNSKELLDVQNGEMLCLLRQAIGEEEIKYTEEGLSFPKLQSSANGAGSLERTLCEGNEDLQLEILMNRTVLFGPAAGGHSQADPTNKKQGFGVQTDGIATVQAIQKTPVGYYLEWRWPKPSELRSENRMRRQGVPVGKAVLEPRPYVASSIGERWGVLTRAFLDDPERFKQANDLNLRRSVASIAAMHAMFQFAKASFIFMLDEAQRTGVIEEIQFQNPAMTPLAGAAVADRITKMVALSRMINFIPLGGSSAHLPGLAPVSESKRKNWETFTKMLLEKVFYSGANANLGFGWNRTDSRNVGKDKLTGNVLRSTPVGEVLWEQLNSHKRFLGAINQAIMLSHSHLTGPVWRGADAQGPVDYEV